MDIFDNPQEVLSMVSLILLLLFSANHSLQFLTGDESAEEYCNDVAMHMDFDSATASQVDAFSHAALHHFRLLSSMTALTAVEDDLGYWVKPRSTTWFSRFLLQEYDDGRWIQMFRMTKTAVFSLANLLQPSIQRKNTKYRLAIPVIVRLACTLFKLSHGASLLVCSELFAVGRSTVSLMLRDVVHAINVVLRSEISWPTGDILLQTAADFQLLCGLPGVVGAIDGTQIPISKPKFASVDYFYFKSGGYSMNCQAVVDSSKRFLDLYVGMPGSTNDARMLRKSTLYHRAQHNVLWDANIRFGGFSPYLLGDAGYPLLPWLMVPHQRQGELAMEDALFNRRMCRGRGIVENAFALLKQSFKELQVKSELQVTFIPDVVICCALLHNVLLKQSHEDVKRLLEVLQSENDGGEVEEERPAVPIPAEGGDDDVAVGLAAHKRRDLGVFLALQRIVPV